MTALRRVLATALLAGAALGLALPAASASGGWLPVERAATEHATLRVSADARIAASGNAVTWPVAFTCPAGQAYTLDLIVIEMDPPLVPELRGEDDGIRAQGTRTGTCTGHHQQVRTELAVVATSWTDAETGLFTTELLPISASTVTGSQAYLSGAGFYALWCAAPACAHETGPRRIVLR